MRLSGLVALGVLSALHSAVSEAVESGASDDRENLAYRKTIKEGVSEYEAHRFEEALSLFRRAHQINPNARTFRGMGMTAFELRDYVSAVRNLSAALRENRKPLSNEQRKHTQELLDRSTLFVDIFIVKVTPRQARMTVDGNLAELEPDGRLLLAFGHHVIDIRAPGMEGKTIPVDVRGGEKRSYDVLLKKSAVEPQEDDKDVHATVGETMGPDPYANRRAKLILGGSIGAALLSLGAGFYWWKENAELASCRHPHEGQRCSNESSLTTWRDTALGTTIAAGTTAVSLAIWGAMSWKSRPSTATVSRGLVGCVPGPFALTCLGRF